MAVGKETRALVMRVIEQASRAPGVIGKGHYDKRQWLVEVLGQLKTDEPLAWQDAAQGCLAEYLAQRIEEYIRSTRDAAIENLRALDALRCDQRQQNRIVQVRMENGEHAAKKLKDCTPSELDVLAEQYEKSAAADTRRAGYYRVLARQMRLAGLAEQDPLSKLLAA
jgi:hypothetical protein